MNNRSSAVIPGKNDVISENSHSTVVCVTNQYKCERLIKAGRRIADLTDTTLTVVNVSRPDITAEDSKALDYLFNVSKKYGALMTIFYSTEALKTITEYIKINKAANVVTGMPQAKDSVLIKLWEKFSNTKFFTVEENGDLKEVLNSQNHIA
ncbi:MAG: hypothetical protein IJO96_09405 [Oscillospiraceae bacterium]|nr:hypothetical protein [Oscillospiraceae bacterium]